MLRIRLQRAGRKHEPHYRVVLAEHSAPVKGKFIERLGFYNARSKDLNLNREAIFDWLSKGAQPSNTVAKLLPKAKISHGKVLVKVFKPRPPRVNKQAAQQATTSTTVSPSDSSTLPD